MSNQEDKNAAATPAGDDKNNPESASDASQIDSSADNKSNVVEIAPLEDLKKLFSKVKDNMLLYTAKASNFLNSHVFEFIVCNCNHQTIVGVSVWFFK